MSDELSQRLTAALKGHSLDTMSQDSGRHCTCGSDNRFEQLNGDLPWASMSEHRANVLLPIIAAEAAAVKAETAKVLGRMAELDNHHNAALCPYCSPPASVAQLATAKADALREAALAWTRGEWSDVMLPKPTRPTALATAYAVGVGDWLRDRAAAICAALGES